MGTATVAPTVSGSTSRQTQRRKAGTSMGVVTRPSMMNSSTTAIFGS